MSGSNHSQKTTYAVMGSSLLHAGLVVAVLTLQVPPSFLKKELVEIQFQDPSETPAMALPVETITPEQTQVPEIAPEPKLPTPAAPAEVVQAHTLPAKTIAVKTAPTLEVPDVVAVEATESTEAQVEDASTQAQEADETENEEALQSAELFNDDSEVLAEKAKQDARERAESAAKISAVRQAQIRAELERVREAREKAQEAKLLKAAQMADENRQKKAQAQAAEIAAAEARYQASAKAAELAAAQAAEADRAQAAAAAAKQGELQGSKGGVGESRQESSVRPLEDIKQMPGNERPMYDEADRLAGRGGQVVFYAFITNAGQPSDFKLIQSSGHKSLDLKTLKAIRGWKFYPGQEGWVEIPFQWDLKGEPTAIGGTLRKVSQK